MGDKTEGNSVPLDSIQVYITTLSDQRETFTQFQKLRSKGLQDNLFLESQLTQPFSHMQQLLCNLFDENNIEMRGIVNQMLPRLEGTMSPQMETMLHSINSLIDNNGAYIQSQVLESNIANAIREENVNQIIELEEPRVQDENSVQHETITKLNDQIEEIKRAQAQKSYMIENLMTNMQGIQEIVNKSCLQEQQIESIAEQAKTEYESKIEEFKHVYEQDQKKGFETKIETLIQIFSKLQDIVILQGPSDTYDIKNILNQFTQELQQEFGLAQSNEVIKTLIEKRSSINNFIKQLQARIQERQQKVLEPILKEIKDKTSQLDNKDRQIEYLKQQIQSQDQNFQQYKNKAADELKKAKEYYEQQLKQIVNQGNLSEFIEKVLPKSICAKDNQKKEYLYKILGNKIIDAELLYRGSDDGWLLKDFHQKCDNKGGTLTLLQVENGDCIGGFTKAEWSSPAITTFFRDDDALLFNLTQERCFPSMKTEKDISCYKDSGPSFSGGSEGELDVFDDPFNHNGYCFSKTNQPGFQIPQDENGLNLLTNRKDGNFTITEIEVWAVKI